MRTYRSGPNERNLQEIRQAHGINEENDILTMFASRLQLSQKTRFERRPSSLPREQAM